MLFPDHALESCLQGTWRERNAKYPVTRDVGKPLGRLRRHQGQNRRRHFAGDQPIDRFRTPLVKPDFNGASCGDRGPNRRAGGGLLVPYRNVLAGEIGHRFDLWTRHENGNQIVRVARRHGCRLLGIAGLDGFGTTPEVSALFASGCGTGAALAIVACSASAVAAATCSCTVLAAEMPTSPPEGGEAATLARAASEAAAALPAGCGSAIFAGGIGTACFAIRALAAGFELSRCIVVAR